MNTYADDSCISFIPKESRNEGDTVLMSKIHKAVSVIQFKVEAGIIKNNPQFDMKDRILLDKIDYEKGTVHINGRRL